MIEQITERLSVWCAANYLTLLLSDDVRLFEIAGYGKLLLMLPVEGKVLETDDKTNELYFMAGEEEVELIAVAKDIKGLLFEFGRRFYYCGIVVKKDSFNWQRLVVDFKDLKFIGETTASTDIPFTHLGVHTEYEILNGSGLGDYIKKAKFLKQEIIAICDKNTLAGTLNFQLTCKKEGLKGILGATYDIAENFDSEATVQNTYEIKLYVVNEQGWINLLKINSICNVEHPNFNCIPEPELLKYGKGLVCVFNRHSNLRFNEKPNVLRRLQKFKKSFGKLFFQIDSVVFYDDQVDMQYLETVNLYLKNNWHNLLEPVLINDSYYVDRENHPVKDYLNKVARRAEDYSEDQYFKTIDETVERLASLFKDTSTFGQLMALMLKNIDTIAQECSQFQLEVGEHKLPKYEFVEGCTNEEFFYQLLQAGFEEKVIGQGKDVDTYWARMEKECKAVVPANFVDYFLILWDIVKWAKHADILVGTGRGSVGGSLIAYLLDIIDIDPIEHKLLFERFLNETRISGERAKAADSLPDVDIDFESAHRDTVKAYISQRFGELHTCSIGTYTRLKLKGGVKDFGAARGLKFSYLNFLTENIKEKIDHQETSTFRHFVLFAAQSKDLKEFFQRYPDLVHVVKFALGQPKAPSIHASAVLVLPKQDKHGNAKDVYSWLPVRLEDGKLISEWEGKYTDRAGFLKEDILGLSQLDKFKSIMKLVAANHNEKINFRDIPLDDPKPYKIFQQGYNEDVFQFNSFGLKSFSRLVKPDCFEDLIAMNALYRPGPMESEAHLDFAAFKHRKKKPKFDYGLQEVTAATQGLYVYQEQIMLAVVVLGGFTLVEADILRTQIKKFDKVEMTKSGERFISGAIKNGCPPDEAKKIWDKLLAFSGYGFNRSHSAAYAMMAYYAQWLKTYYPLEFWTTTIQFAKETQIPYAISEMKKLNQGVTVKPPNVNYSHLDFRCDPETNIIYWSLTKIKNIGLAVAEHIVTERTKSGVFTSYEDFVSRVPKKFVNKAHLTNMILAGCFDEIEGVTTLQKRLQLLEKHFEIKKMGDLPAEFQEPTLVNKQYFWVMHQKYLTGYGDIDYELLLSQLKQAKLLKLFKDAEEFYHAKDYTEAVICGLVTDVQIKLTKKKDPFVKMSILNNNDTITAIFWSDTYEEHKEFIEAAKGEIVAVRGNIKRDKYNEQNILYGSQTTEFLKL